MTTIKENLVIDIAYPNVTAHWNPVTKKDEFIPPDWNVADLKLIKGVICKASQGIYIEDTTFGHNWQELGRLKVPRGAYHFWEQSILQSSGKQAQYFVNVLSKYGGVKAGDKLVLDAETTGMSISALLDFVYNVERLTGVQPENQWIYSTKSLLDNLSFKKLSPFQKIYIKRVPIWVAGYPNEPDKYPDPFKAGYIPDQSRYGKVVGWQYDSEVPNVGNIPGGVNVNWIDADFLKKWQAETGVVIEPPITEDLRFTRWLAGSGLQPDPYGEKQNAARLAWFASLQEKR